jgi:hypothetical protein
MLAEGAFVRAFFPLLSKPREPGLLHICHCLAVRPPLALIADTTSQPWPSGIPLPFSVRIFSREEAAALNQARAFRLHFNRQARTNLSARWLPELDNPDRGIIAIAPPHLRQQLFELTVELEKRHRLSIERTGL